jgi:hypothetical protein
MDLGLGEIFLFVGIAIAALPALVGGVLVILVVANRADPDPTGRRPAVVYSYAMSFISLFVALFATFEIVSQLSSLIGSNPGPTPSTGGLDSGFGITSGTATPALSQHPVGDAVARGVVVGALLALIAGYVYLRHVRAADRVTSGLGPSDPSGRVRSSYTAAVSFICVAIAVIAAVVATYEVFRIVAPGVFNSSGEGSRAAAFRTMLPLVYLALASLFLLRQHVEQLPPDSRPWFAGLPEPPEGTTPSTEVPVIEAEVLEAGPPPRKRAPRRPPSST